MYFFSKVFWCLKSECLFPKGFDWHSRDKFLKLYFPKKIEASTKGVFRNLFNSIKY